MKYDKLSPQWHVLLACHMLVACKLDSGPFGNVSMRIPGTTEYWINPSRITFDNLSLEHLVKVNIDGKVLTGERNPHPGNYIHREIYKLRPDVNAIVHTHSNHTVTLSLLGCEIMPITQLGASFYNDQAVYHGFTGPVRDSVEGHAIAQALDNKSIVIAKNHGLFAVADNMPAALWDMVVADMAADIHLKAKQMGITTLPSLSEESLAKSKDQVRVNQCLPMWENYLLQLQKKSPELFLSETMNTVF